MNAKTFTDDVLSNHVGDKELKSNVGVGTGRMTKKMIEKNDMGLPKEPNKEWKRNEKVQVIEEDAWSQVQKEQEKNEEITKKSSFVHVRRIPHKDQDQEAFQEQKSQPNKLPRLKIKLK
ncbi:hypothetical protein Tco_0024243 [Tanacetum coccineum]